MTRIVEPKYPAFFHPEPIIKWKSHLAEVLFHQHVFIPYHELHHAQLICEGEVNLEIDGCIFVSIDWVCALFQDRSGAEEGYHYKSTQGISLHRPQDLTPSPWILLEPPVCIQPKLWVWITTKEDCLLLLLTRLIGHGCATVTSACQITHHFHQYPLLIQTCFRHL